MTRLFRERLLLLAFFTFPLTVAGVLRTISAE